MLARIGPFFLVPFLVLVTTTRPGLAGLLHEPGSRPLVAKQRYLPLALKWQAELARTIEAAPRTPAGSRASAPRVPPSVAPAVVGEVDSWLIPNTDPLYALMSLQI